jgi:hypothetical protein
MFKKKTLSWFGVLKLRCCGGWVRWGLEEKEYFDTGSSAQWYALRCRLQLTSAQLTGTQQRALADS